MTVSEALNRYFEKFNEPFPVYEIRLSGEELINAIQECLDNNKKYEIEYIEDIIY